MIQTLRYDVLLQSSGIGFMNDHSTQALTLDLKSQGRKKGISGTNPGFPGGGPRILNPNGNWFWNTYPHCERHLQPCMSSSGDEQRRKRPKRGLTRHSQDRFNVNRVSAIGWGVLLRRYDCRAAVCFSHVDRCKDNCKDRRTAENITEFGRGLSDI